MAGDFFAQLAEVKPREICDVSWVNILGVPDQVGSDPKNLRWEDVLLSESAPVFQDIQLRNPDTFMAGGIHADTGSWETVLQENPRKEQILGWIRNKVNITDLLFLIEGSLKVPCISQIFLLGSVFQTIDHVRSFQILFPRRF